MRILILDLETTPDVDTGRRAWGFEGSDAEVGAAMFAKQLENTEGKSDFLPLPFHRIVAFGAVGLNLETGDVAFHSECSGEEGMLLDAIHRRWFKGKPTLVTWNGRGFDLPLLILRSMKHGLVLDQVCAPPKAKAWEKYESRYGDMHLDMMDILSSGRMTKLSDACTMLNIDVKQQGSGKDVWEWWLTDQIPVIQQYVLDDARALAELFLAWAYTSAWVSAQKLNDLLNALGRAHQPTLI